MKLPNHGRYGYSALPKRPDYSWPDGKRLAVCFCNNIEHFAFRAGMGSDSAVLNAPQNQRNYAWRDYGNRVGIWYMLDLFDELGIPASHNINSAALEYCPEIAERLNQRQDEYIGHGRTNSETQGTMWEEDEARLIAECTAVLQQASGKSVRGWLGPYLAETNVTLDLLKEAGYCYILDWPADDQPFWMKTRSGPMLSIPYAIELNDSPALVFRQHSAREFEEMLIDQFDELLEQSRKRPLVYTAVLHPFIIGQPYRLRALRRALDHILARRDELWITTPGRIYDYCLSLPQGILPGS